MYLFPWLMNLLLGDQIILFGITNDTTSALGVALIHHYQSLQKALLANGDWHTCFHKPQLSLLSLKN